MQTYELPPVRSPQGARQLSWIEIHQVKPNPYQPRRMFSEESIAELAESIQQYGLLSPIVVRRMGMSEYELIAGERRLRALKKLGKDHVDAIVLPAFEQDSALIALIENLQREELHFFEEAGAYQALVRDHGLSQDELARRLSKSPSTIANRMRLLRLSTATREKIIAAGLTERHARALLRLSDENLRAKALETAIARTLNVRQLESLVEMLIKDAKREEKPAPKQKIRMYLRDHRMLLNALMDTLHILQQADNGVSSRMIDKKDCVEVVITLPKRTRTADGVRPTTTRPNDEVQSGGSLCVESSD